MCFKRATTFISLLLSSRNLERTFRSEVVCAVFTDFILFFSACLDVCLEVNLMECAVAIIIFILYWSALCIY